MSSADKRKSVGQVLVTWLHLQHKYLKIGTRGIPESKGNWFRKQGSKLP
jgi:hypothetical protein